MVPGGRLGQSASLRMAPGGAAVFLVSWRSRSNFSGLIDPAGRYRGGRGHVGCARFIPERRRNPARSGRRRGGRREGHKQGASAIGSFFVLTEGPHDGKHIRPSASHRNVRKPRNLLISGGLYEDWAWVNARGPVWQLDAGMTFAAVPMAGQEMPLASCGHARLSPFPGSARVERLANIHCRSMRIRRVFVAKPCGKPGVSFRMGAVNLLANMHEIRAHAPNFEAYLSQSHGRSRNRPGNPEPSDSLPNRPTPHPKCDWGTADRWQARRPVRARSDAEP